MPNRKKQHGNIGAQKQAKVLLKKEFMKIKSLSYHNKELNWELEPTEFGRLNLLVGASGVGKTRILEAILDLQRIAKGKALSGTQTAPDSA